MRLGALVAALPCPLYAHDQDELQDTYDACFEEGGQKSCTIQP